MNNLSLKTSILAVAVGTGMTLAGMGSAWATIVSFASGDGVNESNNVSGTNVVITPHPAWGDVGGGAQWISYTNTGLGGIVAPNAASRLRADATTVFTESLGFIDGFGLNVLGDDTVAVDLVNLTTLATIDLFDAFPAQIDPCAPGNSGGVVGCTPVSMGIVPFGALAPGNYALKVYGFQTNNDVYGVQYSGTVDAIPEPTTLSLLGAGLLSLGFVAWRRRRAA